MHQILKRLEIIKSSIAIEDEEAIGLQVMKLKQLSVDEDVQDIVKKLTANKYMEALGLIETYLLKYSGLVLYEDKELNGLKLELKVLEAKLTELSEEKNDYLGEIQDFNVQYSLHVGDIIRSILKLKKEILQKKTLLKSNRFGSVKEQYNHTKDELDELKERMDSLKKQLDETDIFDENFDEMFEEFQKTQKQYDEKSAEFNDLQEEFDEIKEEFENDPENEAYQEAQNDYEKFSDEYEEIINEERYELDEDERIELKKAYRKASKLCHPDIVPDELKEQAIKIFQELNEANSKKDLKKVKEILAMLENGNGFEVASDSINDKHLLKSKIEDIRNKIDEVVNEIDIIKSSDTFTIIQEIEDCDEYFETLKSDLSQEKERLEEQYQNLEHQKSESEPAAVKLSEAVVDENDDYWSEKF